MNLEIKREEGIEERLEGVRHKATKPTYLVDSVMASALTKFEICANSNGAWRGNTPQGQLREFSAYNFIIGHAFPGVPAINEVLDVSQLQAFLQLVSPTNQEEEDLVSAFVSRLMRNSYLAGHNSFFFPNVEYSLAHFASGCQGTSEQVLRYSIEASIDWLSSSNARYVRITLNNVGDHFARNAQNSTFTINGTLGKYFFLKAKNCVINIKRRDMYQKVNISRIRDNENIVNYVGN